MRNMRRTECALTFDGYQPPFYPDKNYSPEMMVGIAKKVHASLIRVSMMGKLAHFPTDHFACDKESLGEKGFLPELCRLAHENDILIAPYVPGAHNLPIELVLAWHPEWLQRQYPNQPDSEVKTKPHSGSVTGFLCPVGPYREFYQEMIDYALLENDVDAWYSDAWKDCYSEPLCYCADCRRQFAADFGEDLYDPAFGPQGERVEEVRSWYHNRLVRMVQEFHAYIKSKKNLPTIINGIAGVLGYESQGVWGREIDDIHDVLHFERKTEPYNHYASASCMRVCGRDGWIYSGLYSPLQFDGPERAADMIEDEHRFPYRKELYCESLLTFACGHSVNVIRANTLAFDESSPGIDDLTDIFTFAREHAELLEGLSYRPSLAVYNEETARHELQDEVFRGLVRAGVQATILKREHLDDLSLLSRFQAIVSRSRDEAANEKLCRYAREGGLLVTTQDLAQQCFPLCAKQGDALMHGRGYVLQHGRPEDAEGLLAAVETKACLPYRVTYPEGELIPVLTANEGTAALYLVNITRHLTGLFDEGLAEIPEVRDVTVRWNAGKPRSVHTLRGGKLAVCETQDGLEIRLDGVKEFEVLILEL